MGRVFKVLSCKYMGIWLSSVFLSTASLQIGPSLIADKTALRRDKTRFAMSVILLIFSHLEVC